MLRRELEIDAHDPGGARAQPFGRLTLTRQDVEDVDPRPNQSGEVFRIRLSLALLITALRLQTHAAELSEGGLI